MKELTLRNILPIKAARFAATITPPRDRAAALKLHHFTNLSMKRKKCYVQSIPNTVELSLNIVTKAYNCLSLLFYTNLKWQATEMTSSKTNNSSKNHSTKDNSNDTKKRLKKIQLVTSNKSNHNARFNVTSSLCRSSCCYRNYTSPLPESTLVDETGKNVSRK